IRVLSIDTGEILAVGDETAAATHVDPNVGGRNAIKALAKKLGGKLESRIIARWTAEASSSRELEMVVSGIKSSKQVRQIKSVLKDSVRGVESITVRKRKKGRAYFTVKVKARAADFARDVEEQAFDNFKVEIEEVTRARVALSLAR
ncbi:unnamed protein product, partial [Laminaria digitata]